MCAYIKQLLQKCSYSYYSYYTYTITCVFIRKGKAYYLISLRKWVWPRYHALTHTMGYGGVIFSGWWGGKYLQPVYGLFSPCIFRIILPVGLCNTFVWNFLLNSFCIVFFSLLNSVVRFYSVLFPHQSGIMDLIITLDIILVHFYNGVSSSVMYTKLNLKLTVSLTALKRMLPMSQTFYNILQPDSKLWLAFRSKFIVDFLSRSIAYQSFIYPISHSVPSRGHSV